jgi:hypothetical protein
VNNCSIPSMQAERKITVCSHKHSFTPYPSHSHYSQMDKITDGEANTLTAHRLEDFFPVVLLCVIFLVLAGKRFWCYLRT